MSLKELGVQATLHTFCNETQGNITFVKLADTYLVIFPQALAGWIETDTYDKISNYEHCFFGCLCVVSINTLATSLKWYHSAVNLDRELMTEI